MKKDEEEKKLESGERKRNMVLSFYGNSSVGRLLVQKSRQGRSERSERVNVSLHMCGLVNTRTGESSRGELGGVVRGDLQTFWKSALEARASCSCSCVEV